MNKDRPDHFASPFGQYMLQGIDHQLKNNSNSRHFMFMKIMEGSCFLGHAQAAMVMCFYP